MLRGRRVGCWWAEILRMNTWTDPVGQGSLLETALVECWQEALARCGTVVENSTVESLAGTGRRPWDLAFGAVAAGRCTLRGRFRDLRGVSCRAGCVVESWNFYLCFLPLGMRGFLLRRTESRPRDQLKPCRPERGALIWGRGGRL